MRSVASFFALVALIVSSFSLAPDVHAKGDSGFAHAADHIYAHGADHFDNHEGEQDPTDTDHSAVHHHHNCSFNLSGYAAFTPRLSWESATLRGPLRTSPLISRVPSVPKQPPKA